MVSMAKNRELKLKRIQPYDGTISGYGGVGMDGHLLGSMSHVGLNYLNQLDGKVFRLVVEQHNTEEFVRAMEPKHPLEYRAEIELTKEQKAEINAWKEWRMGFQKDVWNLLDKYCADLIEA